MKKYCANLSLQAHVPENQSLEPHFKQSIQFNILCPVSGCKEIKANGFDNNFTFPVQFYKCKVHRRTFYAHTSWLMKKLSEIIIQRILLLVFAGSVPGTHLAERYNLSASTLSNLINQSEKYVDAVISRIKRDSIRFKSLQLPAMLEDVIWIDETFFKVGKKSWALILAIDYNGQVLGWKFGRKRDSDEIKDVLTQVGQYMPNWKIVIGDGAKPYATAVRSFHKRAYLIQQFHTHPWERARITEFTPKGTHLIFENVVELDYQALLQQSPQIGYAITKSYKVNVAKRKRGRKKGQKNGTGKGKYKKKVNKKKRGSKSAIKSGRAFQFGHNLNFMQVDWLQPASIKVDTPPKEVISRILWVTFMVFSNKSIVSNRIESLNSEFKLVIPNRGMHNENHVLNRIKRLVQLKSALTVASSSRMKLPVSARVGFNNLLHFFEPDPSQIEFRKEMIKI
ncbi:MAG: DDE-type integrase/transposase/recombinase [Candidatus Heimdallarchaeota archaeon]|nr:DDE-type integrase/transposase/recombinase [Candidatus Heimdallarchaeota archaeon]